MQNKIFFFVRSLQTTVLYMIGELAGVGLVSVTVGVTFDR